MKITIEDTNKIVQTGNIVCRIWKGRTEKGLEIQCLLAEIVPTKDTDEKQFEAELVERKPPCTEARAMEGSLVVVQNIEEEAVPKVRERIDGVRKRSAPEDAIVAFDKLDNRLLEDTAVGVIETDLEKVIEFPGRNRTLLDTFAPFVEYGSLDGKLIRVGGRDETVPVYLEEGNIIHLCNSNREMAKKLAPHLFGGPLRVWGNGRWYRDQFGNWVMDRFTITDFSPLDDSSLTDAVSKLRAVPGNEMKSLADPIFDLMRIRHGTDET